MPLVSRRFILPGYGHGHTHHSSADLSALRCGSAPGTGREAKQVGEGVGAAGAGAPGALLPLRKLLLICRYYVLMTASIAAGGWDRLRGGAPEVGWSPPEGTR